MTDYKPRRSLARASLQLIRGDESAAGGGLSQTLINEDIELQLGGESKLGQRGSESEVLFERGDDEGFGDDEDTGRGHISGASHARSARQSASYSSAPDPLLLGEATEATPLVFEPETPGERGWMWTSVGLVTALSLVSIAISLDWIDWPGDGIGKS